MADSTHSRSGSVTLPFAIEQVFPLLCPKVEEKWIPGWQCEVLHSRSGLNEPGAVFRTAKPYGGELIWTTNTYDIRRGLVEFTNFSPDRFVMFFRITVTREPCGGVTLHFSQTFCPISARGTEFVASLAVESFPMRINTLGGLITQYLSAVSA